MVIVSFKLELFISIYTYTQRLALDCEYRRITPTEDVALYSYVKCSVTLLKLGTDIV